MKSKLDKILENQDLMVDEFSKIYEDGFDHTIRPAANSMQAIAAVSVLSQPISVQDTSTTDRSKIIIL